MTTDTTSPAAEAAETALFLGEDWFDPLEAGGRTRIRSFIEELREAELEAALGRKRYARGRAPETEPSAEAARSPVSGHRHGHRELCDAASARGPSPPSPVQRIRRQYQTYLKVQGRWCYLYRAIDRNGTLVDVLFSEHRDMAAAEAFFRSAKAVTGVIPGRVTTDGHD